MPKFTILYAKNPTFGLDNKHYCSSGLDETHREVRTVEAENLSDVFRQMQGENWYPNGEARELIQSLGLKHTSMSVGDVAYSHDEEIFYLVESIGWVKLPYLSAEYLSVQIERRLLGLTPSILERCRHLIRSGAVNLASEKQEGYGLAHAILCTAIEEFADELRPSQPYYRDVYNNLKHF